MWVKVGYYKGYWGYYKVGTGDATGHYTGVRRWLSPN